MCIIYIRVAALRAAQNAAGWPVICPPLIYTLGLHSVQAVYFFSMKYRHGR